jgi:hypothetical protein
MTATQREVIAQVFDAARHGDVTVTGRDALEHVTSALIVVEVASVTWWVKATARGTVYIRNANGWATDYRGEVATVPQADAIRLRLTCEFGGSW